MIGYIIGDVGRNRERGHNRMPRAKSDNAKTSEELDAEIKELLQTVDKKRKTRDAKKKQEEAAAKQARELAEKEFNRKFVEKSKTVHLSDYEGDGRTVFELIKHLVDQPPDEEVDDDMPDLAGHTGVSLQELLKKRAELDNKT